MRRAVPMILGAALLASGCGSAGPTLRDRLVAAIDHAQDRSHQFTLVLSTGSRHFSVTGLVEDDARYSARVAIDGRASWDEVASDDTLADRFTEPSALALFVRPGGAGVKASVPDVRGELAAARWVVDEVGAPDLLSGAAAGAASGNGHPRQFGQDPVLDGVASLEYVRGVVTSQRFAEFNKNALDYDPAEDSFPKPQEGGTVRRYDSVRTDLPTAAQIQGFGGRAKLPDVTNFRKMSIYVDKQGRVVRVLERIDVQSRLTDLLSIAGLKLPAGLDRGQATAAVVDSLNKQRVAQGDDPIDVHELDLTLTDGTGQHVQLPTGAAKGSLALLVGRGSVAAS